MEWRRPVDILTGRQSCACWCLLTIGFSCVDRHQFPILFKSSSVDRQSQCDTRHTQKDYYRRPHELEQKRRRCCGFTSGRGLHSSHTGLCTRRHIIIRLRSEVVHIQACTARSKFDARGCTNNYLPARVPLSNIDSGGQRWDLGDQFGRQ